ncbi:hypothetical protein B0H13DRAFT_2370959 [Mycena leptocephala]|nr:hypothetical protein B0H13DRAFT_2370959 [Mycena leptocephala]
MSVFGRCRCWPLPHHHPITTLLAHSPSSSSWSALHTSCVPLLPPRYIALATAPSPKYIPSPLAPLRINSSEGESGYRYIDVDMSCPHKALIRLPDARYDIRLRVAPRNGGIAGKFPSLDNGSVLGSGGSLWVRLLPRHPCHLRLSRTIHLLVAITFVLLPTSLSLSSFRTAHAHHLPLRLQDLSESRESRTRETIIV